MIIERVYELALPALAGKKIKEARIGLSLMAVELDNGSIGVTYVLRNEVKDACTALPNAGKIAGMPAEEAAKWALQGRSVIASALGLAVLNAVADFDQLTQDEQADDSDAVFSVNVLPEDTVGVIGHIGPVISRLRGKVKKIMVFERGETLSDGEYPESLQNELLPECQLVFVTSATMINGTLENLLNHCANARDVVMVGSSTPLYPQAFRETKVSVLAGTRWLPSNRDAIFEGISQCAGMKQMIRYGEKISIRV